MKILLVSNFVEWSLKVCWTASLLFLISQQLWCTSCPGLILLNRTRRITSIKHYVWVKSPRILTRLARGWTFMNSDGRGPSSPAQRRGLPAHTRGFRPVNTGAHVNVASVVAGKKKIPAQDAPARHPPASQCAWQRTADDGPTSSGAPPPRNIFSFCLSEFTAVMEKHPHLLG